MERHNARQLLVLQPQLFMRREAEPAGGCSGTVWLWPDDAVSTSTSPAPHQHQLSFSKLIPRAVSSLPVL